MDKNEITIVDNTYIAKDNDYCEESSLTAYCASVLSDDLKSIMSVKKEQSNTSDWIKVEDSLPDAYVSVLIYTNRKKIEIDKLLKSYGWESTNDIVTHWQQLPEPPTE